MLQSVRYFSNARSQNHQSSVDPTEISHFNMLASSWWDPHGPSRLLHLMNPLRHEFIARCLSSQSDPATNSRLQYLDIGCGGGIFAESATRLPNTASVTAIDASPGVLAVAESHKRRDPLLMSPGRLRYLNTPIEKLPKPASEAEKYDIITMFEVIEHIKHPASFLSSAIPHLKPGGWVILSTIARTWTSWITTKVVAEDIARIVPRGTHDWNKYINEDELSTWFLQQGGWESPRSVGVIYVPAVGWREVPGSEKLGNYFFGIRKLPV
ncbi:hexaprenyldihydroxybenzoate methyltransferase mitochondrial precursor [Patellaria atrata CBS 101060]|uniref:Ubiquinone biosynthesis O-methyltransferase, mitochondrial n=1 Tax=Patellaria atrata CBS 101060 TaxID=1346257 RepID=A0A9P4SFM6_9PEZI|nr:hexaprenyldihydroxybenzoate methyltransferase mitochondrial precursor [Patellaria atrata CBS 101060]